MEHPTLEENATPQQVATCAGMLILSCEHEAASLIENTEALLLLTLLPHASPTGACDA
jgi:hypothetical protein